MVLDDGSQFSVAAQSLGDSEVDATNNQQERAKSLRSASSLDIAHKIGVDELADRYHELESYVKGLHGTLQRERDATRELFDQLRADNAYYVEQYQRLNLTHQQTLSEIQRLRLHQPIAIQDQDEFNDDDWNNGNFTDGSALSLNSNIVHKAKHTTIIGPSDSYLVSKVQAEGTSAMQTGEAGHIPIQAGDYTKINFRNLLAHLVDKYKEDRNFSAKDKKDFEPIAIWHIEEALKQLEIPGQIKRSIFLYFYVLMHGWKAALEMINTHLACRQ
jgi:hypothetical protein